MTNYENTKNGAQTSTWWLKDQISIHFRLNLRKIWFTRACVRFPSSPFLRVMHDDVQQKCLGWKTRKWAKHSQFAFENESMPWYQSAKRQNQNKSQTTRKSSSRRQCSAHIKSSNLIKPRIDRHESSPPPSTLKPWVESRQIDDVAQISLKPRFWREWGTFKRSK